MGVIVHPQKGLDIMFLGPATHHKEMVVVLIRNRDKGLCVPQYLKLFRETMPSGCSGSLRMVCCGFGI